ncbi:major facilitator superfamily domain-containing protein [Fomitopsis serialis]|uniref:major facilitator superfamily domain-containing protein n=1 Tax=Fomitopsis serialis TaxID=139415 RepID=UPI0020077D97|nr:major facilitator superfamily domain-containing protein [Neoantrodia serialis]KAH9936158.1 major facilitator superfamily domain-containing protein [Neoantrodia serialis]
MSTQTNEAPAAGASPRSNSPADPLETTPLLHPPDDAAAGVPSRNLSLRFSPIVLITPVAVLFQLAAYLPMTTVIDAIRKIVCRWWYLTNDPNKIPSDGPIPNALCTIPAVEQRFTTALMVTAIVEGLASLIAYSALSSIANNIGRKPAILTVIAVGICADVSMLSTAIIPDAVEVFALLLWLLCQSIATVTVFVFLMNTYVVDLVPAEQRTPALSKISGWATLGGALSFSIGGAITTRYNATAPVYYVALGLQCVNFIYVITLIPETHQKAQGVEVSHPRSDDGAQTENIVVAALRCCRSVVVAALLPLKTLRPTRDHSTGRLNLRLLYCAIHIFIAGLGEGHVLPALMVYLTTKYDYSPKETGYVLTTLTLTYVVVLTLIIPLLVRRLLRPLYLKATHLSTTSDSESVSEVTDEMDVHIVIGSLIIQVAALLLLTAATGRGLQLASIVLYGCSVGRGPVLRSLAVSTVPPEDHASALAAIEMSSGFGMLLSSIILGTLMAATISTVPQAVFWVIAGISTVASLILLLVRDSDRYQPVHNE